MMKNSARFIPEQLFLVVIIKISGQKREFRVDHGVFLEEFIMINAPNEFSSQPRKKAHQSLSSQNVARRARGNHQLSADPAHLIVNIQPCPAMGAKKSFSLYLDGHLGRPCSLNSFFCLILTVG
ncbi:MAG: hypothetical protein C4545_10360 [Anaerolineaceae bacterium]|nr:MAG: hypothetical protein C4545_10360 [Anaerolineaceae bacterium]